MAIMIPATSLLSLPLVTCLIPTLRDTFTFGISSSSVKHEYSTQAEFKLCNQTPEQSNPQTFEQLKLR